MPRISKENYYLDIAETVLERATCLRRVYGAIIVKNDEIISTGYNGAPRGRKNCVDLGFCTREELQVPRGERYELCRSVHAEANAIISASRRDMVGGTIYLCTADREGNMVSFIQSNYTTFGAGVAVPGTGISLQNRGANFSLDPASDNCLAGGKKSYHTIIPGFLLKDGAAVGPFGVMGAFMQPQGQVEVLVSTIDYHMNPQEALDAPRIQWIGGRRLELECEAGEAIADELRAMGHEVTVVDDRISMGRGQIIWRGEDGVYTAGTEPRCDGAVAAW